MATHATTSETYTATTELVENPTTHGEATGIAALGIDPSLLLIQVVNFLVLFLLLRWLLYRPILEMLKKRRQAIDEGLRLAEKAKTDSASAESKTEQLLAEAKAKAAEIINEAKEKAEQIGAEIKAKADQEATDLLERTQAQLANEKQALVTEVEAEVGDLVARASEKVIANKSISVSQEEVRQALNEAKGGA